VGTGAVLVAAGAAVAVAVRLAVLVGLACGVVDLAGLQAARIKDNKIMR
jgi:hypothetical protein